MTPSLARTILNASPILARRVIQRHVDKMADRMRHPDPEGETWQIRLDRDGHLQAGRHELLAVIQADVDVKVLLEDGLDPSPFVNYRTDPAKQLAGYTTSRHPNPDATLAEIANLLDECPPPDVYGGYSDCLHGPWPCDTTRARWLARGVTDEQAENRRLIGPPPSEWLEG